MSINDNGIKLLDPNPAQPGSSFYYSIYKLPQDKQLVLSALQALAMQLWKISECYTEPEVAKVQLGWWQQEMESLFSNKPSHPVTKTLQPYVQKYQLEQQMLQAMIEGVRLSLTTQLFNTQAELTQHYQHTGGILMSLQAQVLLGQKPDDVTMKFTYALGVSLETVRHIVDMAEYLNRGHLYIPLDVIKHKRLDPHQLLQDMNKQKLAKLLQFQQQFTEQCYLNGLSNLPKQYFKVLRPLRLYGALRLKRLRKLASKGFPILEHHVQLHPMSKLFFAIKFR